MYDAMYTWNTWPPPPESVIFNKTLHSGWFGQVGDIWTEYYWTPPRPDAWNSEIGFLFDNPSISEINISFVVTRYSLKVTEYRDVIRYRSLIDPHFAYVGISLTMTGVGVDLGNILYQRKRHLH